MSQYKMILQFQQNTTIYGSQLDYVWCNFANSQCLSGTIEACWSNHKPIYFAYKLPDHVTNLFQPSRSAAWESTHVECTLFQLS